MYRKGHPSAIYTTHKQREKAKFLLVAVLELRLPGSGSAAPAWEKGAINALFYAFASMAVGHDVWSIIKIKRIVRSYYDIISRSPQIRKK